MNTIKYTFWGLQVVFLILLATSMSGVAAGPVDNNGQVQDLATIYVEPIKSTYHGKQIPRLHLNAAQNLTKAISDQLIAENRLQTNPNVHALSLNGLMLNYRDNTLEVHGELFDDDILLVYTLVKREIAPDGDWDEGLHLVAEELLDMLIANLRQLQAFNGYFYPNDCYTDFSDCGSSYPYYIGWGWWRKPGNETKSRSLVDHTKKHERHFARLALEYRDKKPGEFKKHRHWDADAADGGKAVYAEYHTQPEMHGRSEPQKRSEAGREERTADTASHRESEREANQATAIRIGTNGSEIESQSEGLRQHTRIGVEPHAETPSTGGWKQTHESGEWKSEAHTSLSTPAASTESRSGSGAEYPHNEGGQHAYAGSTSAPSYSLPSPSSAYATSYSEPVHIHWGGSSSGSSSSPSHSAPAYTGGSSSSAHTESRSGKEHEHH